MRNYRAGPKRRLRTKDSPRTVTFTVRPPLLILLAAALVILKLTHAIDWSWWWVASPFLLFASIVVAMLVTFSIASAWEKR